MEFKLVYFEDENIRIDINNEKISFLRKSPVKIENSIDQSMYIFQYISKALNDLSRSDSNKREDMKCCYYKSLVERILEVSLNDIGTNNDKNLRAIWDISTSAQELLNNAMMWCSDHYQPESLHPNTSCLKCGKSQRDPQCIWNCQFWKCIAKHCSEHCEKKNEVD